MSNLQRNHRNKIDIGAREYYKNFKELYPEIGITQLQYTKILKVFFELVVKKIVHEMYRFDFKGIGLFYLIKNKVEIKTDKDGKLVTTAPINWVETNKVRKQTGDKTKKVVHLNPHTHGYIYKLKWDKNNVGFVNKMFYNFLPCTKIRKYIAKELLTNIKPLNAYLQ